MSQSDLPPGYASAAQMQPQYQAYPQHRIAVERNPEHVTYAGVYEDDLEGVYEDDLDGLQDWMSDDEFARNVQFGLIDNGLLVAMALAGISLEDYIAKKVGVPGYGVLLGATLGNAVSDGVAALPQGTKAAGGVTLGALIPVIPLGIAVAMKKPPKGTTKNVLLGASAAMLAFAFLSKRLKKSAGEGT